MKLSIGPLRGRGKASSILFVLLNYGTPRFKGVSPLKRLNRLLHACTGHFGVIFGILSNIHAKVCY